MLEQHCCSTLADGYLADCWAAARPRVQQRTIEFRAACQQPWDEHMVVAALSLGIMESLQVINRDPELGSLLGWRIQRKLYKAAAKEGLAAEVDTLPTKRMLARLLEICDDALKKRGNGEEVYLEPLWRRLEAGENPGQTVRRILETDGLQAAIDHLTVPDLSQTRG